MRLVSTKCAICDSLEDCTIIYENNFDECYLTTDTFSARRLPDYIHYQIVKCNKDSLIRSNPIIEESSLFSLYKKSKFTYAGEIENLTISYLAVLNPILKRLSKDAKILEIGCGNGFILKALYEKGYKNVFGVEPSNDAVEKADKRIKDNIRVDMLCPGIFDKGYFDLIFFFQTFDHVKDPSAFLRICYDLLSPAGYILAFNHDIEALPVKILKHRSPVIDIGHIFFYSKTTIRKLFEKNNFMTLKVYSPTNIISLGYLFHLLPIPRFIKTPLLSLPLLRRIFRKSIEVKLGNLCITAKKTEPSTWSN